uniref:Protein amnionless n=1 Tax=Panagrolaimus sp. PS1159 TaxID=55785 RepID=A0AC35FR81_9BILA
MEGQFIFQIGPKLENKMVIDKVEYQMPNTDIIRIQFSEICRFVECPDWKPYCTNPVKPFGHCCQVCGAIAIFYHPSMNMLNSQQIASSVAQETLPDSAGLDISRVDKTAVIPKYQISVFTENFDDFDESSFYDAAKALFDEYVFLAEIHDDEEESKDSASMFTGFEINYSLETGKIRLRPLLETLFIIGLLGAVIAVYLRHLYKTSPRFRLWLSTQDVSNRMTVAWRNAKEYTEEKVEVILRPKEPEVHAFAHYRNQPENDIDPFEAASYQASSSSNIGATHEYSSEFRNPTFVEYTPEELFETKTELLKEEIKEENLFDLNF